MHLALVDSHSYTVYSAGVVLLTSAEDVVGRWMEYFEDLLNPTDTSSEAGRGDKGAAHSSLGVLSLRQLNQAVAG